MILFFWYYIWVLVSRLATLSGQERDQGSQSQCQGHHNITDGVVGVATVHHEQGHDKPYLKEQLICRHIVVYFPTFFNFQFWGGGAGKLN